MTREEIIQSRKIADEHKNIVNINSEKDDIVRILNIIEIQIDSILKRPIMHGTEPQTKSTIDVFMRNRSYVSDEIGKDYASDEYIGELLCLVVNLYKLIQRYDGISDEKILSGYYSYKYHHVFSAFLHLNRIKKDVHEWVNERQTMYRDGDA